MAELALTCGRQHPVLECLIDVSLIFAPRRKQFTVHCNLKFESELSSARAQPVGLNGSINHFSSIKPACTPAGPLLVWVVYSLAQPMKYQISRVNFLTIAYHVMFLFFIYWPLKKGPIGCPETSAGN
jgi:hypothetical protein